jgi:hypothetical protein
MASPSDRSIRLIAWRTSGGEWALNARSGVSLDRPRWPADLLSPRRSLYNNIRTPGQLQPTATFYLFKSDIEPKWEDPKNVHGGCWTASVNKGPTSKGQLDAWWLNGVSAPHKRRLYGHCSVHEHACMSALGPSMHARERHEAPWASDPAGGFWQQPPQTVHAELLALPSCATQVLACIGEQFTDGDEVCGIAVNIRPKGDRIELWTKTASNEAAQVRPHRCQ